LKYYSCIYLENHYLTINGRIDTHDECISICCENIDSIPQSALYDIPEKSINAYLKMRADIISESVRFCLLGEQASSEKRKFTSTCATCARYQLSSWPTGGDGLIHYVNLSMYPAPCQCKCFYCSLTTDDGMRKITDTSSYEKLFDLVEYADKNNMIAPNAIWQVSSGEITVHPYRDRILNLVKDKSTRICTNAFIFDEKIGTILATNPRAVINLSIDAGTPETWYKIKGVNNFETISNNLAQYFTCCCNNAGQIIFKYIILPGINDSTNDYKALIELMKSLKIGSLDISRDNRAKYEINNDERDKLVSATGRLIAMLHINKLKMTMYYHTPDEQTQAFAYANTLIKSGQL